MSNTAVKELLPSGKIGVYKSWHFFMMVWHAKNYQCEAG